MKKSPAGYAWWVREVHNMKDDAPLDVDRLAESCEIEVYEDQFDGFLGLWFRAADRHGIALASGQIRARRRFTLAHELGHACMPGHSRAAVLKCLATDLSGADPDKTIEKEANEFAAELLAPRRLVEPMLRRGAVSLAKAQQLADHFDISLTAGARRVVESSGQPSAMVVCQNGRISWSLRRNGFPFGLPEKGDTLPEGTVAAAAWGGHGATFDPEDCETFRWLPGADEDACSCALLESAVRLGDTGQVLVLLWMPDAE